MHVCMEVILKDGLQKLHPAERREGKATAVKWSVITALAYVQEEGGVRAKARGELWEGKRMEGSSSSFQTVLQSSHRGLRWRGRAGVGGWLGGGKGRKRGEGGGVLIQPSQWVDVTCLHTQQCASAPARSQNRDGCTTPCLRGSLLLLAKASHLSHSGRPLSPLDGRFCNVCSLMGQQDWCCGSGSS